MSIPSIIRPTISALALLLGIFAIAVFAADIVFDNTAICAEASVLKQLTNCETGSSHPLIGRWWR